MRTSDTKFYTAAEAAQIDLSVGEGESTILFVGDVMTWSDQMKRRISEGQPDYPFVATSSMVRSADFSVANLEGPVAVEAAIGRRWRFPYKMDPRVVGGIKRAGFDLVSTANNHLIDCGKPGIVETLEHLRRAGLPQFGAGRDLAEAARPYVAVVAGVKVAFLAYTSPETWIPDGAAARVEGSFRRRQKRMRKRMMATPSRPGTVVVDAEIVDRAVRSADKIADLVVVYPHWGIRYEQPVYEFQTEVAHAAIDAGADLVVGHHIHTWQPIERYKDRMIIYGLGNFAFDSRNRRAREGLVARVILADARFDRVELHPLFTRNVDTKVDFQAKLFKGESAKRVLERLAEASRPLGAVVHIRGDRGLVYALPVAGE
ncbi:MAG: CapA family protein [Nannocystaceae bacterium]